MNTEINKDKLEKIIVLAYQEVKSRETDGRSKGDVVSKIIDVMKEVLNEDDN